MTINHQTLRELAEKATKGNWTRGGFKTVRTTEFGRVATAENYATAKEDASFIAAANPQTILALLDEVEALRVEAGRLEWLWDQLRESDKHWFAPKFDGDNMRQAIDAARHAQGDKA